MVRACRACVTPVTAPGPRSRLPARGPVGCPAQSAVYRRCTVDRCHEEDRWFHSWNASVTASLPQRSLGIPVRGHEDARDLTTGQQTNPRRKRRSPRPRPRARPHAPRTPDTETRLTSHERPQRDTTIIDLSRSPRLIPTVNMISLRICGYRSNILAKKLKRVSGRGAQEITSIRRVYNVQTGKSVRSGGHGSTTTLLFYRDDVANGSERLGVCSAGRRQVRLAGGSLIETVPN